MADPQVLVIAGSAIHCVGNLIDPPFPNLIYEEHEPCKHFPTQITPLTLVSSPQNVPGAGGKREKEPISHIA